MDPWGFSGFKFSFAFEYPCQYQSVRLQLIGRLSSSITTCKIALVFFEHACTQITFGRNLFCRLALFWPPKISGHAETGGITSRRHSFKEHLAARVPIYVKCNLEQILPKIERKAEDTISACKAHGGSQPDPDMLSDDQLCRSRK